MLLGLAVGWVRIFYVCFKKIRLGVGKSKSRSVDANKKTEGLMYSNAGGELRNISSTRKILFNLPSPPNPNMGDRIEIMNESPIFWLNDDAYFVSRIIKPLL